MKQFLLFLFCTCSAIAAPADYNAINGFGTYNSRELNPFFEIEIAQVILSEETTQTDGRHLLKYQFQFRNVGSGYQEAVQVLLETNSLPWTVETVDLGAGGVDLPPGSPSAPSLGTTTSPLQFMCAAVDAPAIKTALAAQQYLKVSSTELYTFSHPLVNADLATNAVYTSFNTNGGVGNVTYLTFSASTPTLAALAIDTLFLHNPVVQELPGPVIINADALSIHLTNTTTLGESYRESGGTIPSRVTQVKSLVTNTDGTVTVGLAKLDIKEIITSGLVIGDQTSGFSSPAVRDPYNPPLGNSFFTTVELAERLRGSGTSDPLPPGNHADLKGLFTLHYPFNEVELSPGVTLDGEFLLRGLKMGIVMVKRDGQNKKLSFKLTNHMEAVLRLTAQANTTLLDQERSLVYAPLPPIVIPFFEVLVTFQPVLKVKAGCTGTFKTRVQVPFQCSVDAGYTMTVDLEKPSGQQYNWIPYQNITPLEVSPPDLSQALAVTATPWIEAAMDIIIQGVAGPGISVRAQGEFEIAPLATPWWQSDMSAELAGRFSIDLLGINVATVSAPILPPWNIFHKEALGPYVPGVSGPLESAEGDHLRWARAAKWTNFAITDGRACRVHGTADDFYVTALSTVPATTLLRLDSKGNRVWSRALGLPLQHLVSTSDGGVVIANSNSSTNTIHLLKYDSDGTLLWQKNHSLTFPSGEAPPLVKVARLLIDRAAGGDKLFLCGYRVRNAITLDRDPLLLQISADGDVILSKVFNTQDSVTVNDAIFTPDGNIVMCGEGKRSPGGNVPGAGDLMYGWLLKTSRTGSKIWSTYTETFRGNYFNSVTTSPEGLLYTCGFLTTVVGSNYGSAQITQHTADGAFMNAVTLSESPELGVGSADSSAAPIPGGDNLSTLITTNSGGPGAADWLPNAGNTLWDEGRRLYWSPNGLIVATTTGLGVNRALCIGCLTPNLAARWFTTHEGFSKDEGIFDIIPTNDGILALGSSAGLMGSQPGAANNTSALLLKLPLEGLVNFNPRFEATHRYLQPGIHNHGINEFELQYYQPSYRATHLADFTIETLPVLAAPAISPSVFLVSNVTHWVPLEEGNPDVPMTYAEWAAYHQIPATSTKASDYDQDGRSNGAEWFFGGDPYHPDPAPLAFDMQSNPDGTYHFTFNRSHTAAGFGPLLETSHDLQLWNPLSTGLLTNITNTLQTHGVSFTLPAIPGVDRAFYRLSPP